MSIRETARAKVNLTLVVLGRRADGYHEIESLVTFAGVHDVVTLQPGATDSVVVDGPFAQDIGGENLLARALTLLHKAVPNLTLGAVRLQKNLPVAAGLGGGSADAGALLRAVRRANPEKAAPTDWRGIAEMLGADVPVCLAERPALMGGKGERVSPVARLPQLSAVLVNPRGPLETARVFGALAARPLSGASPPQPPVLDDLDGLLDYVRGRGNHLERVARTLMPAIDDVKAALEAQPGCRLAAMSGSGPTCFGLYENGAHAARAAERIASAHPGWWTVQTTFEGAGVE